MSTVIDQIRELKTRARNRRDLGRWDTAAKFLDNAISLAKPELKDLEASEGGDATFRRQLASELADCYGLLGGVERRWSLDLKDKGDKGHDQEHLRKSIAAYDKSWDFEKGDYGLLNSYGRVNRLVSRLLFSPSSLQGGNLDCGDSIEKVDVRKELEFALDAITKQLAVPRRDDYWAAADWALLMLLLEKESNAEVAYARFDSKSPPGYAYSSVLDVLRPLANSEMTVATQLSDAVVHLEARFKRLQTSAT